MSRKWKYVGPFDEVEIAATGQVVGRGETVEVEDPEISKGLEGQETWEPVVDKKRSAAAKKAAETRAAEAETEPAGAGESQED